MKDVMSSKFPDILILLRELQKNEKNEKIKTKTDGRKEKKRNLKPIRRKFQFLNYDFRFAPTLLMIPLSIVKLNSEFSKKIPLFSSK